MPAGTINCFQQADRIPFDGGRRSSDTGVPALREAEWGVRIAGRLAGQISPVRAAVRMANSRARALMPSRARKHYSAEEKIRIVLSCQA